MAKTRARSCTGKKRETKEQAWEHYYALKRKGATGIHVYKCKFCPWHHVGHYRRRR